MKSLYLLLVSLFSITLTAQPPANYYNSANGLTGFTLKTELKNIITTGYSAQTYNSLITLYDTSDNDEYYPNQGETVMDQTTTIVDMYSENPTGADAYNYIVNTNSNCGNFNSEGDCYNREHIYPQGFFSQMEPMRSDAHHVIPTDGWVNGGRSNLPFGRVNPSGANITTYSNGSRKGPSITTGFTGTVFEPIDEFKGDIARMLLYFATRYEDNISNSGWDNPNASNNNPRDGSTGRFYEQWYIDLLLDWHAMDPVSQKELDRNNAIFTHQSNRNPYIDNPQYVGIIWSTSNSAMGDVFATLQGSFIDVNNDNVGSIGDRIDYTYTISNIGTTDLFNIVATPNLGNYVNPGQINRLNAGVSDTDAFGTLSYILQASDLNTACNCVTNKLTVTAFFNMSSSNGSVTITTDDPDNFTNNDANGDLLPDDETVTTFPSNTTGGTASELFISEYLEGSGNNKAIEVANFTGSPINLSDYTLQRDANGNGSWSGSIGLNGTLNDQQIYVIARGNASMAILNQADQLAGSSSALNFNGNDPVGLFKNNVLIDVVGTFGAGGIDFAQNETLIRKPAITGPNTTFNKTAEWNVLSQDDSSDLGMHTYDSTASITSDNLVGVNWYPNPSTGHFSTSVDLSNATIQVYDALGRNVSFIKNDYDISLTKSGWYLVKITLDGKTSVQRLIVR